MVETDVAAMTVAETFAETMVVDATMIAAETVGKIAAENGKTGVTASGMMAVDVEMNSLQDQFRHQDRPDRHLRIVDVIKQQTLLRRPATTGRRSIEYVCHPHKTLIFYHILYTRNT